MPRTPVIFLALAGLIGPLTGSSPAQHVVYAPSPAPIVITEPSPVVYAPTPTYAVRPNRRELRRTNQYTTYRPTYGGRPAVTFAPYSDRYFPTANNTPTATTYLAPRPTYYVYPR